MITFTPTPPATDLPTRFPSPFDRSAVHPLARRAAEDLLATLSSPDGEQFGLDRPGAGKMFVRSLEAGGLTVR